MEQHEVRSQPNGGGAAEKADSVRPGCESQPAPSQPGQPTGEAKPQHPPPSAEELAALRAKAEERDQLFERLQRVTANFINAQRRERQEMEARIEYALQGFVRDLLPVADSLERTITSAQKAIEGRKEQGDTQELQGLLQGVQLIDKQLKAVLANYHITPIEAEGKKFDPELHEAVSIIVSQEHPDSTVVAVLERGYRLKDRVIRPARVLVSKREAPAPSKEDKKADKGSESSQ